MPTQENQSIIDRINAAVKANDAGFGLDTHEVQGPIQTQVLMKSREYRNKPLNDGMELTFKGVRGGAKKQFIFEFEPTDDQEFTQVEFSEAIVFDAIKGFEDKIALALLGEERAAGNNYSFTAAKNLYLRDIKKLQAEEAARAEARRLAAEKEANATYEANETFGMF